MTQINEGVDQAVLRYRQDDKILDFYSTYVPTHLRGKGVAAKLAEAAFEYAEKNQYKVIPSCSFIADFVSRFPKYQKFIHQR